MSVDEKRNQRISELTLVTRLSQQWTGDEEKLAITSRTGEHLTDPDENLKSNWRPGLLRQFP